MGWVRITMSSGMGCALGYASSRDSTQNESLTLCSQMFAHLFARLFTLRPRPAPILVADFLAQHARKSPKSGQNSLLCPQKQPNMPLKKAI
jgi:hypothetical protein